MNSPQQSQFDAALDRALSEDRESLLPSLGFADSVMAAVTSEGPGPLRFPWKRALPGLMAGIAALAGFAGLWIWVLERAPAARSAGPALGWTAMLATVVHDALRPDTSWVLAALLIPVVTLWLMRRLLFSR